MECGCHHDANTCKSQRSLGEIGNQRDSGARFVFAVTTCCCGNSPRTLEHSHYSLLRIVFPVTCLVLGATFKVPTTSDGESSFHCRNIITKLIVFFKRRYKNINHLFVGNRLSSLAFSAEFAAMMPMFCI